MTAKKRSGLFDSQRVLYLPVDYIVPNPNQPRTMFVREGLEELADSIAEHGILQPLSVREVHGRYQLISGERRLRAARMVGLSTVPCILVAASDTESALLALVENLQRRDLDFLEEAVALRRLIVQHRPEPGGGRPEGGQEPVGGGQQAAAFEAGPGGAGGGEGRGAVGAPRPEFIAAAGGAAAGGRPVHGPEPAHRGQGRGLCGQAESLRPHPLSPRRNRCTTSGTCGSF